MTISKEIVYIFKGATWFFLYES